MTPDLCDLYEVIDHTWPAHKQVSCGPWTLREGRGGGKRVSAATLQDRTKVQEIKMAEKGMRELGQIPLFMVRDGEEELDHILQAESYKTIDAVNIYCISSEELSRPNPPRLSMFDIWEPLEIQKDIWAQGGIGRDRVAVMERAKCAKTSLLMRWDNHPAGTAYIGVHKGVGMVHALEILPQQRRKGVGALAMRHAAIWALSQTASHMSVICTKENKAANALYASLKMRLVGGYHYRIKEDST